MKSVQTTALAISATSPKRINTTARMAPMMMITGSDAHVKLATLRVTPANNTSQRDGLAEFQIIGAIDFAHFATPEQSDDPVSPCDD
jgi:hypothetical protein